MSVIADFRMRCQLSGTIQSGETSADDHHMFHSVQLNFRDWIAIAVRMRVLELYKARASQATKKITSSNPAGFS